jgi:hypothetical protein
VCVCVCVCARERERERECVCVCVWLIQSAIRARGYVCCLPIDGDMYVCMCDAWIALTMIVEDMCV